MELYDIETNSEVFRRGIHVAPELTSFSLPEKMVVETYHSASKYIDTGKFPTFFGGEHSISIGIIRAFQERFRDLSVLQIDAHADLRDEYDGSKYNHACALHEANQNGHVVQVGIRSMDVEENKWMNRDQCYFMHDIRKTGKSWMSECTELLRDEVYITLDLDALDPSIMPATGTPEPGGFEWYELLSFLRMVFSEKTVVGFDIVELAPIGGLHAPQFLTAKLYYKMLSYKFENGH
jgi:agmatinase